MRPRPGDTAPRQRPGDSAPRQRPGDTGRPWSWPLAGRWEVGTVDSVSLRANPLGDPSVRPVWVYLPPGYDDEEGRWPVAYLLRGHTGQVDMWANRRPFAPTFLEAVDGLFAGGDVPPAIVVLVDGWTSWGGAQYLDTPAIGRYSTYLCEDVVGWVDRRYRTIHGPGGRALIGHSSGGYGAVVNGLLRPDVWGAVGSHAGDALFEACYLPDFPVVTRTLVNEYGGSWDRWWDDVRQRGIATRESDHPVLNLWCMAACYSPEPNGRVVLPMDATGRLDLAVWARWLAWDPVRMVASNAEAARSWRAVWVDGGARDEVFLDLGARALRDELVQAGVDEGRIAFEIHGGRHGGQEARFLLSVRFLVERLARG